MYPAGCWNDVNKGLGSGYMSYALCWIACYKKRSDLVHSLAPYKFQSSHPTLSSVEAIEPVDNDKNNSDIKPKVQGASGEGFVKIALFCSGRQCLLDLFVDDIKRPLRAEQEKRCGL